MDEKEKRLKIKIKDSEKVVETEGEEAHHEEGKEVKEKPIEKMTKAELLEKLKEVQQDSESNYELYLRAQAEIENMKRRNKREKEEWIKYATENLIKDLLQVLDNMEMALTHSNNENSHRALQEGVELTLKGLRDTLAKSGLEEVEALGKPFDPNFHQAVSQEEDKSVESGIILKELQKGYTMKERLIRPAMVIVNKG